MSNFMIIRPVRAALTRDGEANSRCRNSANATRNEEMERIRDEGEGRREKKTGMHED
jgi:hypothetical protein